MFIVVIGEESGRAAEFEQAVADFGLDWEVSWVARPDEIAIGEDARPVDALVCDMVVHGRLGSQILTQMRKAFPEAVRILLMDEGQELGALQALDCAHRLLRKPLEAGELIEAVESVIELRELLDSSELKQVIGRVDDLPPPPNLYIDLTQLMRDPDASTADIAEVLSQDPALAAKILRLCNSAYFSSGRVISDIRTAVTRLGLQTIQQLVLATEVFGTPAEINGVDRDAMQERALRTSRLAGQLLGGPSAELAATAGLLAEVGMLLPGVAVPGEDGTVAPGDGTHYAEAGAYLLGLWGLPMPIVEAVAYHHRPQRMRMAGFWVGGAVHVASALVAGTEVDEDYLRTVGQIDKLPKWRAMAEQLQQAA